MCMYVNRLIGLVDRVFANGPGDLGSIPGKSGLGSDGNEGVLRIPQSSSTAGA